ncbi:hypothetical protein [Conexibacter arvalis]|uniref:SRPBCC family protein n=1 Tax=Conexibacter arvalis TaxID=912552 RepID=A0A840ID31_9ACTN|nr:hypothetical protein [Conexibacter arvalis]MBB4661948.1 hypothetical protein [Conexibacter arvalis]
MPVVSVSTDLPLPAERACELAARPALFAFVVRPFLRVGGLPERFPEPPAAAPDAPAAAEAAAPPAAAALARSGEAVGGRLWWLGVVPAWTHRLRVVSATATELRTEEGGGPVRRWAHTLVFEPRGASACRYTDRVELDAGLLTPLVWCFAQLLFRWRQARWRALARVIA